ncbi:MAG: hypothetical protein H5U19_11795 [Rhodobacteraceae bacterium]|nr:hypothetical protein [Paracoccaceae bacterium]
MTVLRPEAMALLLRWREAIIGAGVAAMGLYGAATTVGIVFYLSLLGLPIGAALIREGVQRARMPEGGYGPGVIEVDERQITYFGPRSGSAVSVDALTRIDIVTTDRGPYADDVFWVFHAEDAAPMVVPFGAVGSDRLYDALTALPGLDPGRILAATRDFTPRTTVIWQRVNNRRRLS